MIKYCTNVKCKLFVPIYSAIDGGVELGSSKDGTAKTAIVGRCTCCGAASGDCLRCGKYVIGLCGNCDDASYWTRPIDHYKKDPMNPAPNDLKFVI